MVSLWNIYFLLPLSLPHSLHAIALTGENVKETQQPDSDTAGQFLKQLSSRPHVPGLAPSDPMIAPEDDDFLGSPLSWSLSSSFLLPGSLPSHTSDQNSTSSLPTGPGPDTLGWTTGISVTTKGNRDGFIDITDLILQRETASMEAKEGKSPLIIYSIPTLNLKMKLCPIVHFSFLA